MLKTLLLITSAPESAEARRALALAKSLTAQGRAVTVALLQDAVLAALDQSATAAAVAVRDLLAREVPVHVSEQDLTLRGYPPVSLHSGAVAADDHRLVDLMLADGTRTLGCF